MKRTGCKNCGERCSPRVYCSKECQAEDSSKRQIALWKKKKRLAKSIQ